MSNLTLNDVCIIKGGSGFPEKYQGQSTGEYPFAKVSDMELPGNKRYLRRANNYMSRNMAQVLRFSIFPQNTVIFAKVGAALLLNRRRILAQDTIIDNNMMGLTPTGVVTEYKRRFKSVAEGG